MALAMQIIRPLLITLLLEGAAAWIIGIRDGYSQRIIVLVNAITNPILNVTLLLLNLYLPYGYVRGMTLAMEVVIFLVEGLLFLSFLKDRKHPFLLSLYLNAGSFFIGKIIHMLIAILFYSQSGIIGSK